MVQVGKRINHKRVYRLWREERLCVPARRRYKRLRGTTPTPARALTAERPNAVWCFDFVQEKTIHGQKLRVFCVSDARMQACDEFTRESLAIEVGTSFVSERVCQTLDTIMKERGVPSAFRMDNAVAQAQHGPEFIALALRGLCHRRGIHAGYIDPGKPWQNGFAESFHSRLRDEFMDGEVFYGVKEAQVRLNGWRRYFNEERLHSSLGYQTPRQFVASFLSLEGIQTPARFPVALSTKEAGTEAAPGT